MKKIFLITMLTIATGFATCQVHAVSCPYGPWNSAISYSPNSFVFIGGKGYVSNLQTQGQNPATNSGASGSSWTLLGKCDENYVAGTPYKNGQRVINIDHEYSCTVSGWCSSSASWAFAPGAGAYWNSAWSLIR